jgi:hypothetical protein
MRADRVAPEKRHSESPAAINRRKFYGGIMEKKTYSEKLKDPRWQKMRLQILERDEWCCQRCFESEKTLHVHHLRYIPGRDPWDYGQDLLITLCMECHENEKEMRQGNESDLLEMIKDQGFMAEDVHSIASGIHLLDSSYPPDVTATIIEYALSSKEIWGVICKSYFEFLKEKADK